MYHDVDENASENALASADSSTNPSAHSRGGSPQQRACALRARRTVEVDGRRNRFLAWVRGVEVPDVTPERERALLEFWCPYYPHGRRKLGCDFDGADYERAFRKAILYVPAKQCADMLGAIELAEEIYGAGNVSRVEVIAGEHLDSVYRRVGGVWHAYEPYREGRCVCCN